MTEHTSQHNYRLSMPSKKQILNHWKDKLLNLKPVLDYYDCDELDKIDFCFACGKICGLERAHITAVSDGGNNECSNIHLLCQSCHRESEMYSGEFYWFWFNEKDWETYIRLQGEWHCKITEFVMKKVLEKYSNDKKILEELSNNCKDDEFAKKFILDIISQKPVESLRTEIISGVENNQFYLKFQKNDRE